MYVTTNSAVVWKRMADENRDSAKLLARIAMALFVLLLATGAYAFSSHNRLGNVCQLIANKEATAKSIAVSELADSLLHGECA